ncbi:hypothetical protein HBH75_052920 [Parastagonospora nodorum]|nr:hypothetical protein HBH75_052920 [Parastagonospora nodorum]
MSTPTSPQLDRVRDTMSFSNILTSLPASAASPDSSTDVTVDAAALTPPFTPTKSGVCTKVEDDAVSPGNDTEASDLTPLQAAELFAPDHGEDLSDDERGFVCMNDESSHCVTGQYTKDLSRKVISDHFGRNKACTRDIDSWPLFCRKHYQRATYNKDLWQIRKLNLIYRQFEVIEKEFPGTTYNITLKKSEAARLEKYCLMVMSGRSVADAAAAVASVKGKHFEAPIEILRELYMDMGDGKSLEEVKDVVEKIHQQITEGSTAQVPSIEFLPNLRGTKGSPKKAPKTPEPKKPRAAKTPTSKGTPGRVSAKGSVKKPAQKA